MHLSRIGGEVARIVQGTDPNALLLRYRQAGQLAVHGRFVAAEFGRHFLRLRFNKSCVFGNLGGHAVTKHCVTNACVDQRARLVTRFAAGSESKEFVRLQMLQQRVLQFFQELRARHRFSNWKFQSEDLISGHLPALGVVISDLFGFGHLGVIDHHDRGARFGGLEICNGCPPGQ